jgi:hypothetical protein
VWGGQEITVLIHGEKDTRLLNYVKTWWRGYDYVKK